MTKAEVMAVVDELAGLAAKGPCRDRECAARAEQLIRALKGIQTAGPFVRTLMTVLSTNMGVHLASETGLTYLSPEEQRDRLATDIGRLRARLDTELEDGAYYGRERP